jgi:hypothetical protein
MAQKDQAEKSTRGAHTGKEQDKENRFLQRLEFEGAFLRAIKQTEMTPSDGKSFSERLTEILKADEALKKLILQSSQASQIAKEATSVLCHGKQTTKKFILSVMQEKPLPRRDKGGRILRPRKTKKG